MTHTAELLTLCEMARARGAVITVTWDELAEKLEGRKIIESVQVHSGLRGVGPHPMDPISAAERLREVLACPAA